MENKRIEWLDVARAIAIISITFNHAVNRSFCVYNDQYAEFKSIPIVLTIIKTVLYAFSRVGVPLFLMISGALLLVRDYRGENTKRFLTHNWLQLLITTEIWLTIMFWYKQLSPSSILAKEGIIICIVRFFMTICFLNPFTMGSMWYMPMILCLYLMIPLFALGLRNIDHKFFILPLLIVTASSFILADANGVLSVIGSDQLLELTLESSNIFSMFAVFLLLGYFISQENLLARFRTHTVIMFCIVSFGAFCVFPFWCFSKEPDYVVGEGYKSIFLLIPSVFLFELIRRCRFSMLISKIGTSLSRMAFGIYFVHICIMELLDYIIDSNPWNMEFLSGIAYLPKFLVLEIVSFVGSLIIIRMFSTNRWISKNVFGIK